MAVKWVQRVSESWLLITLWGAMVGTPSDHSGGDLLEQLGLHMEARVVRFALREASSIFVKLSVGLTLTFDQGGNIGGHWCSASGHCTVATTGSRSARSWLAVGVLCCRC